jgi:hypothetical protein
MTNDALNAAISDAAHWRMLWDGGLAWVAGPFLAAPACMLSAGALIMRRWPAPQLPRPAAPLAIGSALRPATSVTEQGATPAADKIYYVDVERVSGGGVIAPEVGRLAQPAVYDGASDYVGAIPNPPLHVKAVQNPDGKLRLEWVYNPAGEQATPAAFHIYSDEGGGALMTPALDTVSYVPGQRHYSYTLPGDAWDGWQFLVLAQTAAGVRSLAPLPTGGVSESYGLYANDAILTASRLATAPDAPQVVQAGSKGEAT